MIMFSFYQTCEKYIEKKHGMQESALREAWGTIGSATGIVVNLLLAAIKFIVGVLSGSVAAVADAANNLSDAGGSVMSLVAVRLSGKRETANNPFGYGRMEYLGALGVGVLILMMGFELLKSGVQSILHPEAIAFSWLSLILLIVSVLGKLWLYFIYRKIALPIKNSALLAAAQDSLSDCAATLAVILSMLTARFLGWKIDGIVGVLVSVLVLKAGYDVLSETVSQLLGGKPDHELGEKIVERVMSYEYVHGVHDFVMHDYGPGRCMASIHVEVPADGNLVLMHEVIDRMEREIQDELNVPLCVHLDPVADLSPREQRTLRSISAFLELQNPPLRMHDFRVVPGENQINLIFDIVVPPGYEKEEHIMDEIRLLARSMDERYRCVIHCDKDYYHV